MRLTARRWAAGGRACWTASMATCRPRSDKATWRRRPGDFVSIAQYFIAEDSATARDHILLSITYFRKKYIGHSPSLQCSAVASHAYNHEMYSATPSSKREHDARAQRSHDRAKSASSWCRRGRSAFTVTRRRTSGCSCCQPLQRL